MKLSEINLCMITDNNYVIPTAVAMTSAIQNKTGDSIFHFYILTNNVSTDNLERLAQLRRQDVIIDFIEVDASKYQNINVKSHVPQSAALKFDIPNLIKEDKVLYIDGDIIVCGNLAQLYKIPLGQKLVAAVRDMGGELTQHFNINVGCDKYFNSGVLLLNLKKLRQGNYTDLLIKAKFEHPQWKCMDQDALNYVLSTKTKWIDVKYNSMIALYQHYGYNISEINAFYETNYATMLELEQDSVIIHLAGEKDQRPWKVINGAFGKLWDSYYEQSPYRDIILQRGLFKPLKNKKVFKKVQKYNLFGFIPLLSIEEK